MTQKKQRGGGMHSEYCPLCLLSYEDLPEEEDEDEDEEEEKEENQLRKLSKVDLGWLKNGLAFDRDTNEIIPVEGDDMYGRFPIKGRRNDLFNDGGPVYHEDCIKYISTQLNRPITYADGIEVFELVKDRDSSPYQSQHFEWEDAIEEEGPAYFYSPMDPKGKDARERINQPIHAWISRQKRVASPTGRKQLAREEAAKELSRVQAELQKAIARVDELRREVAASEAALSALSSLSSLSSVADSTKNVKKTRKVASKSKQSKQSKQSNQSKQSKQSQANCASHNTKEECPPTDCVWGKTNRCSKKRSLGKNE